MAKEFFKNLPDTSTPLNASRFNGLLNGSESFGNIVVGDVKCKNLFNKNAASNGFISTDSTSETLADDNLSRTSEWISCKPNTYYTVQGGDRRRIQYKNPSGTITYSSYSKDNSEIVTFLTSSDTEYFRIYLIENINNKSLDDIQIEEGPTATEYTPYKNFEGKTTAITGYEMPTNEYIDGKRVYRLRKNLGKLPNNESKQYDTGLDISYQIVNYELYASLYNQRLQLPFFDLGNTNYISGYMDSAQLAVVGSNWDTSSYSLIMDLYYTK